MNEWTHDGLAADLARSRTGNGEAVACPLSLGSFGRAGAVDVASIRLSRTRPESIMWEVKRTRSDFWSDVNAGKYLKYLPYCHRLYFATPAGLISKDEVPEGVGWVVRGDKGWSGVKAAPRRQVDPDAWAEVLMSHLMAAHPGPWQTPTRVCRLRQEIARETTDIGLLLASRDERIRAAADRVRDKERDLDAIRRRVADALGGDVKDGEDLWVATTRALAEARRNATEVDPAEMRLACTALARVRSAADDALSRLERDTNGRRV